MPRPLYYVLDDAGDPLPVDDYLVWARWWQATDRHVAIDKIGDTVEVSTVFLGLDYAFYNGPPLLYETMVFGGAMDGQAERYPTRDEAIAGHNAMVVCVAVAENHLKEPP